MNTTQLTYEYLIKAASKLNSEMELRDSNVKEMVKVLSNGKITNFDYHKEFIIFSLDLKEVAEVFPEQVDCKVSSYLPEKTLVIVSKNTTF